MGIGQQAVRILSNIEIYIRGSRGFQILKARN